MLGIEGFGHAGLVEFFGAELGAILLEVEAVAVVGALGGGEIALDVFVARVIGFGPVGDGIGEEKGGGGVELTFEAEEMPLGEGGAGDEALGDVVGSGVLEMPLGEVGVEVVLRFVLYEDEGGCHAVGDGVLAGDGAAFFGIWAGFFFHVRILSVRSLAVGVLGGVWNFGVGG